MNFEVQHPEGVSNARRNPAVRPTKSLRVLADGSEVLSSWFQSLRGCVSLKKCPQVKRYKKKDSLSFFPNGSWCERDSGMFKHEGSNLDSPWKFEDRRKHGWNVLGSGCKRMFSSSEKVHLMLKVWLPISQNIIYMNFHLPCLKLSGFIVFFVIIGSVRELNLH